MDSNNELLLENLAVSRNLSSKTKQSYINALKCYVKFNNETFSNLLKEAENEEDNHIRWKKRKIKQRLINFRIFLQEKYLLSTAKVYFQRILTLYGHYEIEIHRLSNLSTKSCKSTKPITFEDLPTKKIIKDAFEIANPIMRAIILFISSSGCARNETLNITIQDFIDATWEYHNKKDVKDALFVLKGHNDVIPCFRINRQKNKQILFYILFTRSIY